MSQMKEIIIALALAIGFTSNAQTVVYSSGDFTTNDAIRTAKMYGANHAINTYNSYEGYLITSDGKINGNDLGNLDNVLQFFNDIKTGTSTEMYTITPYTMGTMEVVFKGNNKKYYITPYLRKDVVKTIKAHLAVQ